MSKYDALWAYIQGRNEETLVLRILRILPVHRWSNALTSEAFAAFIQEHSITDFYVVGADAAACIKSTCYNMTKSGYTVHVLSDCITSYDKRKLPEMLAYIIRRISNYFPVSETFILSDTIFSNYGNCQIRGMKKCLTPTPPKQIYSHGQKRSIYNLPIPME